MTTRVTGMPPNLRRLLPKSMERQGADQGNEKPHRNRTVVFGNLRKYGGPRGI
jgi:hypothetical protein